MSATTSSSNDVTTVAGMPKLTLVNWFRWYPLVRWALKGLELWSTIQPGTSHDARWRSRQSRLYCMEGKSGQSNVNHRLQLRPIAPEPRTPLRDSQGDA
ncbi:hypothetical protein A4X09_0g7637 [Tilletia walkeri]|uniref:Uncharacterized protein n=1 Tax=Tilletia walkeri TaxID=117179 RepID=A0A8X7N1S9_9BASI|nr:hypothetical protein A4X09_0g7637 [Tilletia walkeri]